MILELLAIKELNKPVEIPQPKPQATVLVVPKEEPKPSPILYSVVENDSLTKIAEKHNIPVDRLWAKNTNVAHQDTLKVGESLIIPTPDEILAPRAFVAPEPALIAPGSQTHSGGAENSLNGYTPGQCTAFVASKRYVPPGWGNASNWRNAAIGAGWIASSSPVAGAIGWTSGHVVYVESVNGDGTVTISEQNYDWNSGIRTATFPVGKYVYLYE